MKKVGEERKGMEGMVVDFLNCESVKFSKWEGVAVYEGENSIVTSYVYYMSA